MMTQRATRGAWMLLGGALAIYAAVGLWLTRGTTLFIDEQHLFVQDNGLHPSALLAPFNGHLFLLERLVYAVDFKLFGASFVLPRLLEVAGVALVAVLFYVLASRRIGGLAALAPTGLLLFFGTAWENILVPSGIGTVYAAAGGLGAFLALESDPSTSGPRSSPARDAIACGCLIVSVASWTLGVAFALGALVLVLLEPRRRQRVWIALVPLALYAGWLVWVRAAWVPDHGEVQRLTASNILLIPNYIADEASSVMGALAGLNYDFTRNSLLPFFGTRSEYGAILAVIAAAGLVIAIRRGNRRPVLWALLATLLAFWVALALAFGNGRDPTSARYVYGGGILVLLTAAEAARRARISNTVLIVLGAAAVMALGANIAILRDASKWYRSFATSLRAQLTAVELARGTVAPNFYVIKPPSFADITAGPYLAAVDRIGSPAYSQQELERQSERVRHAADSELVAALRVGLVPHPPGGAVGPCRRVAPGTAFVLVPPGVTLRSAGPASLALRRFASASTVPIGRLAPGQAVDLRIPRDASARPWQASISPSPPSLQLCTLPAGG